MSEDISSKVKKIVADHLGIDEAKVTEEASFIDDLGADSLDTVELVMAFEEEFGSEISDSDAEKILTVGDAVKFIEEITGKRYNNNVRKNITRLVREKVIRSKTTSNIIDDYNKAGGDKAIDQSLMGGKVLLNKEDLKFYFTWYR